MENFAPPSWSEVTSDPRWKTVDQDKKLQILKDWSDEVKSYATDTDQFDPEKHAAFISTQFKGITSDKPATEEAAPEQTGEPTQESVQAFADKWASKLRKKDELKTEEERARIASEDMDTRDAEREKAIIDSLQINPVEAAKKGYKMGAEAGEKIDTSDTGKKIFGAAAAAGNVLNEPFKAPFFGGHYLFKTAKAAAAAGIEGDKNAAINSLATPDTPVTETKNTNVQTGNNLLDAVIDVGGDTAKNVLLENPEMGVALAQGGAEATHKFALTVAERMGAEGKPLPKIAEQIIPESRFAYEMGRKQAIEKAISQGVDVAKEAPLPAREENQAAALEAGSDTQAEAKPLASSSGTDLENIGSTKSEATGTIRPLEETATAESGLPSESNVNLKSSPLNLTYVSDIDSNPISFIPRTQEQLSAIKPGELNPIQKPIMTTAKFTGDELMKLLAGPEKNNPNKASGAMMRQLAAAVMDKQITIEQAAQELRGHYDETYGDKTPAKSGLVPNVETDLAQKEVAETEARHRDNLKPSNVETDQATRQQLTNSMNEGQAILKSKRTTSGRKMTEDQLKSVERAVNNTRAKLGLDPVSVKDFEISNPKVNTVLTFDEFSNSRGVSSTPPSFPESHRASGGVSKASKKAALERVAAANEEWQSKRDSLKLEYDNLVREGQIREPDRIERLKETANGSGERAAAAKRVLEKMGISSEPQNLKPQTFTREQLSSMSNDEVISNVADHFLHELPKEVSDSIKAEAKQMQSDIKSAEPGKRFPKSSDENPYSNNPEMIRGSRGYEFMGTPSEYPEWYGKLKRNKESIQNALKKIIKDAGSDKGKLVESLKRVILERKLNGFIDKDVGVIPPDHEFRASIGRQIQDHISMGPGAASAGETLGTGESDIARLTRSVEQITPGTPAKRVSMAKQFANALTEGKSALYQAYIKSRATTKAFYDSLTKLSPYTDFKRNLGEWLGELEKSAVENNRFSESVKKTIPDPLKREAIYNWIQAGGDEKILTDRAQRSKTKYKAGYEEALKLTPEEKAFAGHIRDYFDTMLKSGVDAGILEHGVQNYVSQLWEKNPAGISQLLTEIEMGQLNKNFKFAQERFYNSSFDGEQEGLQPKTKDVAAIVALYDQSFKQSVASRAFIKQLTENAKATDGRPLIVLSGAAAPGEEGSGALFVHPQSKPEAFGDYVALDHPALRGWKWIETDGATGKSVFMKGEALVHPEVFKHLRNIFETSQLKENKILSTALRVQSFVKQNMLSLGMFHMVQEAQHAIGYGINPFKVDAIDLNIPVQRMLVDHGLKVASFKGMEQFSEGLAGGNKAIVNKIPFLGDKVFAPFQQWLFHDYIPKLKMKTAEALFERNVNRYSKELQSGKITSHQIAELSANQANAAYGELNYKYMGRRAIHQDIFRMFALAPDFLEARVRNVAQAFTKYGAEQRANFMRLGLTTYVAARIINKLSDDDYHWKEPFNIFMDGKRFGFRILPEDLHSLITDPTRFISGRISPLLGHGIEFLRGVDYRGAPISKEKAFQNLILSPIPSGLSKYRDKTRMDTLLTMMGVQVADAGNANQIYQLAKDFNKTTNYKQDVAQIHAESRFKDFRTQLQIGEDDRAKEAIKELLKDEQPGKLLQSVRASFNPTRPFTGSNAQEAAFVRSLDDRQRERYKDARNDNRELFRKAIRIAGEAIRDR